MSNCCSLKLFYSLVNKNGRLDIMGLFDLFDVMKKSARKRKKTEKYRKSAKEYIQGGKSLYNKAYSDIVCHVKETNDRIEQHYRYKQHLLWEISQNRLYCR